MKIKGWIFKKLSFRTLSPEPIFDLSHEIKL